MKAKSHCKLNVERDEGARELARFYDFSRSYRGEEGGEGRRKKAAFIDGEGGELVLPNGTRLGHRSLKTFYR